MIIIRYSMFLNYVYLISFLVWFKNKTFPVFGTLINVNIPLKENCFSIEKFYVSLALTKKMSVRKTYLCLNSFFFLFTNILWLLILNEQKNDMTITNTAISFISYTEASYYLHTHINRVDIIVYRNLHI